MIRWIFLLAVLGGIYWIYQRDYAHRDGKAPRQWRTTAPGPTLTPGTRLGGGIDPAASHDGFDTPPRRPKAP